MPLVDQFCLFEDNRSLTPTQTLYQRLSAIYEATRTASAPPHLISNSPILARPISESPSMVTPSSEIVQIAQKIPKDKTDPNSTSLLITPHHVMVIGRNRKRGSTDSDGVSHYPSGTFTKKIKLSQIFKKETLKKETPPSNLSPTSSIDALKISIMLERALSRIARIALTNPDHASFCFKELYERLPLSENEIEILKDIVQKTDLHDKLFFENFLKNIPIVSLQKYLAQPKQPLPSSGSNPFISELNAFHAEIHSLHKLGRLRGNCAMLYPAKGGVTKLAIPMPLSTQGDLCDLLDKKVKAKNKSSLFKKLGFFIGILDAYKAWTDKGIVAHRDIKLDNILIYHDTISLIDGNFAVFPEACPKTPEGARFKNIPSQAMGTVAYMAPELVKRLPNITAAVDIYSLGVTFLFILLYDIPGDFFITADPTCEEIQTFLNSFNERFPIPEYDVEQTHLYKEFATYLKLILSENPDERPTIIEIRKKILDIRKRAKNTSEQPAITKEAPQKTPKPDTVRATPKLAF